MNKELKQQVRVTAYDANNVPAISPDERIRVYTSKEHVCNCIPITNRSLGLTVPILEDGKVVEYWFEKGIRDVDLALKHNSSIGDEYIFDNNVFKVTTPDYIKHYIALNNNNLLINNNSIIYYENPIGTSNNKEIFVLNSNNIKIDVNLLNIYNNNFTINAPSIKYNISNQFNVNSNYINLYGAGEQESEDDNTYLKLSPTNAIFGENFASIDINKNNDYITIKGDGVNGTGRVYVSSINEIKIGTTRQNENNYIKILATNSEFSRTEPSMIIYGPNIRIANENSYIKLFNDNNVYKEILYSKNYLYFTTDNYYIKIDDLEDREMSNIILNTTGVNVFLKDNYFEIKRHLDIEGEDTTTAKFYMNENETGFILSEYNDFHMQFYTLGLENGAVKFSMDDTNIDLITNDDEYIKLTGNGINIKSDVNFIRVKNDHISIQSDNGDCNISSNNNIVLTANDKLNLNVFNIGFANAINILLNNQEEFYIKIENSNKNYIKTYLVDTNTGSFTQYKFNNTTIKLNYSGIELDYTNGPIINIKDDGIYYTPVGQTTARFKSWANILS